MKGKGGEVPRVSWKTVKLGSVIVKFDSQRIPLAALEREKRKGPYPYYGANGIIDYVDDYLFDGEYILFAEDGNTVINKDGYPTVHRAKGKFWVNNHAHIFQSSEGCDQEFLYHVLTHTNVRAAVTGAAQPKINQENMDAIPILLPPLSVQGVIAGVLGGYDEMVENNRRRMMLLEKMARELYREMFVRRGGKHTKTVSVKDVCLRIGSGGTPSRRNSSYWNGGTIDWFKTKELFDDWLIDSEEKITDDGLAESSAKIFEKNTLVMAIYAAPTVGRLGVLAKPACTNQAALCLVANEKIVSWQWLFFLLQEKRAYFNRIAAGAGQQNISADIVKNCEFELPEKAEIDKFTKAVAALFEERLNLALQTRKLEGVRDRLLPRLMSGKLSVEGVHIV